MTQATHAVLRQALALGPVDRAELIEALFRSFDSDVAGRIDALWAAEGESRIDAFDAGELTATEADAVFARIGQQ